jgi:hypothetical protein
MKLEILSKNKSVVDFVDNFKDSVFLKHIYKIEHSAKVKKNAISSDRIILQFFKNKEISIRKILDILRKYNFPTEQYENIKEKYTICDSIIFSIDASISNNIYKIYFEYESFQKIFGIKWNNEKYDITHYLQRDKKDFIDIVKDTGFNFIPKFNANMIGIYYIYDEKSGRKGFNFIFNNGDVYLKDLPKNVLDITTKDINKELDHLKEYPIRHFSGGVDKNGEQYFNLYFVTNEYTYDLGHG